MNQTVLIVDDDADIRAVLSEFLEDEGYAVATAAHGAEALHYLRTQAPPALVLLDLMMPTMDGFQFRQEQRRDASIAAIPVVVMTASGAFNPDAFDVEHIVAKPIDLERLLDALDRTGRKP